MYRLNISYKQFYITLSELWLYESDPNAPSTCSEPVGKQWQHRIWGWRNWKGCGLLWLQLIVFSQAEVFRGWITSVHLINYTCLCQTLFNYEICIWFCSTLFCFVVIIILPGFMWFIFLFASALLHWQWGNGLITSYSVSKWEQIWPYL